MRMIAFTIYSFAILSFAMADPLPQDCLLNDGWSCCSSSNQCSIGKGDCDNDSECSGNLVCSTDNCGSNFPNGTNEKGEFHQQDCCTQPTQDLDCTQWACNLRPTDCTPGSPVGKFNRTEVDDKLNEFWSKVLQSDSDDVDDGGKHIVTIIGPTSLNNLNWTWIEEWVEWNSTSTYVFPMDKETEFDSEYTLFCTQPEPNEMKCKYKYKSLTTNITKTVFGNDHFCDWGFTTRYDFPDGNISTSETYVRI